MANPTGFIANFLERIKGALPTWWADIDVVRDAILSAPAEMFAWGYRLLAYVKIQTRLATSMDVFLDLFAMDYFGPNGLLRKTGEVDNTYRQRISNALFAPRGTRSAMIQAILNLTGKAPIIFEPHYAKDTGGWGGNNDHVWRGLAYGYAGGWGGASSSGLPFQALITVYRPSQFSIPNVAGYGSPIGGWGVGSLVWGGAQASEGGVTDADIYAEVARTMPAASIGWVTIV